MSRLGQCRLVRGTTCQFRIICTRKDRHACWHQHNIVTCTCAAQQRPTKACTSRRVLLAQMVLLKMAADAQVHQVSAATVSQQVSAEQQPSWQDQLQQSQQLPDYGQAGPFGVSRLPRLEHTCHSLFPQCVGTACLLRLDVYYPKGGAALGRAPPYPLAIFSSGFLVQSSAYHSWAQRLASWGWVVVLYDKAESPLEPISDEVAVRMVQEIMDWSSNDPILSQIACNSNTFLCGHSRGGKVSVLAAALDPRVSACFCCDPVDNTVWAPVGPGFPSALQALRDFGKRGEGANQRIVPLAVVGSALGGDCAPRDANFRLFYDATTAPAWQVAIDQAGHFQFLDSQSTMQRAVCAAGPTPDADVRAVSQAVMVAWAELFARPQQAAMRSMLSQHSLEQILLEHWHGVHSTAKHLGALQTA